MAVLSKRCLRKYTRIVKASSEFRTLRSTVPRHIVEYFQAQEGDILSWQSARLNGEKIAILTKFETNTPFTLSNNHRIELTNGPVTEPE